MRWYQLFAVAYFSRGTQTQPKKGKRAPRHCVGLSQASERPAQAGSLLTDAFPRFHPEEEDFARQPEEAAYPSLKPHGGFRDQH